MQPINNDSITIGKWATRNMSTVEAHKYINRHLLNSTYYSPMRTTAPSSISHLPRSDCYGSLSFVNKYMDCTKLAAIEAGVIIALLFVILACAVRRSSCFKKCVRYVNRPVQPERVFSFSPTQSMDSDSDDEHIEYLSACPSRLTPEVINDEVEMMGTFMDALEGKNHELVQTEMIETYINLLEFAPKEDSEEKMTFF